jgi:hypothetical protein
VEIHEEEPMVFQPLGANIGYLLEADKLFP